ncbi:hypothetical protein C8R43DRAFT_992991 [Mycena crocata]|nr:hypothetical protein C8R43DRAFT_992991 [Mycena crocata]
MTTPNIPSLIRTLQIPTKVHSVYLVGSRLWGTHTLKSDFDLLIVVADPPSSSIQFQKSQHKGQYDATLLSETEFGERVKEGSLIEILCCLFPDSEECVFVDDGNRSLRRRLIEKDHLHTMRGWAEERGQKDRDKAMKFWAKGGEMRERGWKILQHMIAAECILGGLQKIVDEEGIALRDVKLSQEFLQQLVGTGRGDGDRAWLELDWVDVQEENRKRVESIKII